MLSLEIKGTISVRDEQGRPQWVTLGRLLRVEEHAGVAGAPFTVTLVLGYPEAIERVRLVGADAEFVLDLMDTLGQMTLQVVASCERQLRRHTIDSLPVPASPASPRAA